MVYCGDRCDALVHVPIIMLWEFAEFLIADYCMEVVENMLGGKATLSHVKNRTSQIRREE